MINYKEIKQIAKRKGSLKSCQGVTGELVFVQLVPVEEPNRLSDELPSTTYEKIVKGFIDCISYPIHIDTCVFKDHQIPTNSVIIFTPTVEGKLALLKGAVNEFCKFTEILLNKNKNK